MSGLKVKDIVEFPPSSYKITLEREMTGASAGSALSSGCSVVISEDRNCFVVVTTGQLIDTSDSSVCILTDR